MPWIRQEDANSPSILKIMSINPAAMEALGNLNQAITFGASTLTRVQEEAIATTVSVTNKCRY